MPTKPKRPKFGPSRTKVIRELSRAGRENFSGAALKVKCANLKIMTLVKTFYVLS